MIGRVTPLMTSAQVLANINEVQNQLATTQEQLSTGRSINRPSDNPYGASLAVQLNAAIAGLASYSNNVADGTAWASAATSALQNIQSMVQRVQEVMIQASNGTESDSDLQASAAEVSQLTDAIKQEANTQYAGQYIFSGAATGTAPYSGSSDQYQGDHGAVTRDIGPNSSLAVNVDLSSVLGGGSAAGDGGLLDTLRTIVSDMTGTPPDVADLATNQIDNLSANLTTLEGMQASVGATTERLNLAASRIQTLQTSDATALSDDEDVNIAQAYTTFSNEQAAFTAALRAGANIVQSSLMDFLSTS